MRYQVKCQQTDEVLFEGFSREESVEWIEDEQVDAWIHEYVECRGCGREGEEQHDAYGYSTGHWCGECYESDRYPYRKDRYEQ